MDMKFWYGPDGLAFKEENVTGSSIRKYVYDPVMGGIVGVWEDPNGDDANYEFRRWYVHSRGFTMGEHWNGSSMEYFLQPRNNFGFPIYLMDKNGALEAQIGASLTTGKQAWTEGTNDTDWTGQYNYKTDGAAGITIGNCITSSVMPGGSLDGAWEGEDSGIIGWEYDYQNDCWKKIQAKYRGGIMEPIRKKGAWWGSTPPGTPCGGGGGGQKPGIPPVCTGGGLGNVPPIGPFEKRFANLFSSGANPGLFGPGGWSNPFDPSGCGRLTQDWRWSDQFCTDNRTNHLPDPIGWLGTLGGGEPLHLYGSTSIEGLVRTMPMINWFMENISFLPPSGRRRYIPDPPNRNDEAFQPRRNEGDQGYWDEVTVTDEKYKIANHKWHEKYGQAAQSAYLRRTSTQTTGVSRTMSSQTQAYATMVGGGEFSQDTTGIDPGWSPYTTVYTGSKSAPGGHSWLYRNLGGVVNSLYITSAITGTIAGTLAFSEFLILRTTLAIATRRGGLAIQSQRADALAIRTEVENGATLYRTGTFTGTKIPNGQYWAVEHPYTAGYTDVYGLPHSEPIEFIQTGTIRPGAGFITRPAPQIGGNAGGAIEVVVNPGDVIITGFTVL